MDKIQRDFIALLSAAITSRNCELKEPDYVRIMQLSQAHGVANMLYHALPFVPENAHPNAAQKRMLKELAYGASARDVIQDQEWETLKMRFAEEGIYVLPLKGRIIKDAYPKQGIRYMSDTDLLIDPEQAEKVKSVFEDIGYTVRYYDRGLTDFYISSMGMCYEAHRSVRTEGYNEKCSYFLERLMSYTKPENGYILSLPNEEHYAYIICHFVKHLIDGGIGVRQVMDIYICRACWNFDEEKLTKLLAELELSDFSATLERLANQWFADGSGDEITEELGSYILGSGVFGNDEQKVADRMLRGKNGKNKFTYVLTRVFPPYKTMCFYYPIIKKCPLLLPIYWIWRIVYAGIFRRKKLSAEIGTLSATDAAKLRQRAEFYQRCGLSVYKTGG